MASYINSDKINCFPTAKRGSKNKLITENSVTRLINRLLDVNGYVITTDVPDIAEYSRGIPIYLWENGCLDFEFVIRGYYFCVYADKEASLSGLQYLINSTGFNAKGGTTEHSLYATIYIDKTNPNYPELYGQETPDYSPDKWMAVQFTIDEEQPVPPSSSDNFEAYTFLVVRHMQNDKGVWGKYIPVESLFKFTSKSIQNIDGGEVVVIPE